MHLSETANTKINEAKLLREELRLMNATKQRETEFKSRFLDGDSLTNDDKS